ncbi:mandelate racemase/muconate lactonizing enzyme family protein [Halomontanus rarus]|uniref:mandelate racemase/muconate lactonizing enzyme family protein n=1 Tax=Halomontanus rarus TaxID=3034020 RepID=UPI00293C0361|nr:mandelate racemase/muconate lactonizing enzyme family protein [Halovivax sp. KZCA124]
MDNAGTVTDLGVTVELSDPDPEPIRDAIQELPGAGTVTVTVHTDTGVSGSGTVFFGRIEGGPETLETLVNRELRPLVVGSDPVDVRQIRDSLLATVDYQGGRGLSMFGIAAIDTALWDCLGRVNQVPCWQLWGGACERIPAYAMVGWLNHSPETVADRCREAVDQGFSGVKIKVGAETRAEDRRRVEAAREAVGTDVDLMVDANQALSKAEAVRRARIFEEYGVEWYEEPLSADAVDDYATLIDQVDIPVATGENLSSPAEFSRFLHRDAVDIVQPDLRRIGGPTALLTVGTMADAFGRQYASHGGGAVEANVLGCLANTRYFETGLLDDDSPFELVDGCIDRPSGPGFAWE